MKDIMIHCSATPDDQSLSPVQLAKMHAKRGINKPGGYHVYITRDGAIHRLRDFSKTGAHCRGFNTDHIGICYEGGIKAGGNPNRASHAEDTRTPEQKKSISKVIVEIINWNAKKKYFDIKICGHRDKSPDKNGNGKIEKWEYMKQCPCFDVIPEYQGFVHEICQLKRAILT